ncbi:uncharacterized protein EURHEDRAFT_417336 [Aspergillus ruber CBS 135680]|uniref:Secreted protein n=1 Tax=Aspergillus ruber (strain CBS 135680) TaxID=1388766 RepID=A0A017S0M3_ASPRC|nr:uncharacterized protein EURHEDRAFT_417336 [Aspergillus ruber CBS 135680]EYE90553.1 hypothetical protein EURHEDRAFT_417336 [Aspergillus ruber CBS 135680]
MKFLNRSLAVFLLLRANLDIWKASPSESAFVLGIGTDPSLSKYSIHPQEHLRQRSKKPTHPSKQCFNQYMPPVWCPAIKQPHHI